MLVAREVVVVSSIIKYNFITLTHTFLVGGLLNKREEETPVRITKMAGTKGSKTNSKNKGTHKQSPQN